MSQVELNPSQRAAVEHGEGPLLIVAGAGTGKTRVIVERIGYLLGTVTGLEPEQILALTFANKAADEMRQRAAERFGEQARRCRFSTFHAFCYELLCEAAPSRALDRIDQWIFLRRHLEELELDYYFKASEPGRFLADLADFCSRCHDNLVTPAEFSQHVERLGADFRAASPAAQAAADGAAEELDRQQEVARVYSLLEKLQEEQGLVSFGAMISRAVRLLDSAPELLRRLQQQYQYILVDEFQDTNTAQFELLVRLAGARKNLTVVGDDDQAIYQFRGASYASFDNFKKGFPQHRCVVLDRNYRSTKKILSVAGAAISFNGADRYIPEKILVTDNDSGPGVEVWEFADEAAQAEYIAQQIAARHRQGEVKNYSDFAVLYRAHHHRDRLVQALGRCGVPFAIRNLAINDLPVIRDLVACLRVIGDLGDSVSLVRVLADPRWQVPAELMVEYCRQASHGRRSLAEVIEQGGLGKSWRGRQQFLDFLRRFRALAAEQRLASWFPLLTSELGLPRVPAERRPLETFSDFLSQWDREKGSTGLLGEFIEYFAYFEEAGGTVSLKEESEDASSESSPASPQRELWEGSGGREDSGKVQLMTIHGSKGLEFEHVIVLHLVRRAFPTAHRRPMIELPPALWKGPLPRGDFHLEEERRLFYVALTRARHSLVLATISNPRQRPSVFLDQLQETPPPDLVRKRPLHAPGAAGEKRPSASPPAKTGGAVRLAEWIAAPVAPPPGEFTLSISQLETYLECPLKYHFRQQWQIPVPMPPPLLFGSIVHGAVKEVVFAVAHGQAALTEEGIREILERRWPPGGFPDSSQDRKYRQLGLEQLLGVSKAWGGEGYQLLYQEKPFELRAGGCRVVGRIDQLHRRSPEGVELIEYKSGRPQSQKEVDRSRQITLYAEACRRVLALEPASLVLYNLTNLEPVRTQRTEKDFRELELLIRETARQILSGQFPATPGYHCRYCSFRAICPAQEEGSIEPDTIS